MQNSQELVTLNSLMPKQPLSFAYQDETNSRIEAEELQTLSRIQIQSNSLFLNSRGVSFQINNGDIINSTVLYIELPPVPANVTMQKGWGLRLLDLVTIYIAGASPYQQNYQSLYANLMREAGDDQDKVNQILELCGNSIIKEGDVPRAVIFLPLPWSSPRYVNQLHTGFDTALLRQPIRVVIDFASIQNIAYGSGTVNLNEQMAKCYMQFRTEIFRTQKDMSFRMDMAQNPNQLYNYQFYYNQTYESPSFAGSTDPSQPAQVALSGFRNASLLSITFLLKEVTATPSNNPLYYDKMERLVVNYNGTDLYKHDDPLISDVFALDRSSSGKDIVVTDFNNPAQVTSPFTLQPVESNWTTVLFCARDERAYSNVTQSGINLSNQTVQCTFTTPKNVNTQYRLTTIFTYSASYLLNNSNAEINYS